MILPMVMTGFIAITVRIYAATQTPASNDGIGLATFSIIPPFMIVAGTAGGPRRYRFATALQKESARSGVQDPMLTLWRWQCPPPACPALFSHPGGAKILPLKNLHTHRLFAAGRDGSPTLPQPDYAASIQSVCVNSPVGAMVV